MTPRDDEPLPGVLASPTPLPRAFARTLMLAAMRMDAMLAQPRPSIGRGETDRLDMWSKWVPLPDGERRVDATFGFGDGGTGTRRLSVVCEGRGVDLHLAMHPVDHPEGWTGIRAAEWVRAFAVFQSAATVLRALAGRAALREIVVADPAPRVARARAVSAGMRADGPAPRVRLPWALGEGLAVPARGPGPFEAVPDAWCGERVTLVRAERRSERLHVVLAPVEGIDGDCAIDSMRRIRSLPPLALRAAA